MRLFLGLSSAIVSLVLAVSAVLLAGDYRPLAPTVEGDLGLVLAAAAPVEEEVSEPEVENAATEDENSVEESTVAQGSTVDDASDGSDGTGTVDNGIVEEVIVEEVIIEDPAEPETEAMEVTEADSGSDAAGSGASFSLPQIGPDANSDGNEGIDEESVDAGDGDGAVTDNQITFQSPSTLPTIGGSNSGSNLVQRQNDQQLGDGRQDSFPPIVSYSADANIVLGLPNIGVIFERDGDVDIDPTDISLPLSFLVNATSTSGGGFYSEVLAGNHEVFMTATSESPFYFDTGEDANTALSDLFDSYPVSVGYVQDPVITLDRAGKSAVVGKLGADGRGFLEFTGGGFGTGGFGLSSSDAIQGTIEVGVSGEVTDSSITRAIERAALEASRQGSVILILPLRRSSWFALQEFQASIRGDEFNIVPVTAVIR
ncbi:MAG: hypothetical protein AAF826_07785 [Pseudomonadota bacterium]